MKVSELLPGRQTRMARQLNERAIDVRLHDRTPFGEWLADHLENLASLAMILNADDPDTFDDRKEAWERSLPAGYPSFHSTPAAQRTEFL